MATKVISNVNTTDEVRAIYHCWPISIRLYGLFFSEKSGLLLVWWKATSIYFEINYLNILNICLQ
jgi:hypothetical protein